MESGRSDGSLGTELSYNYRAQQHYEKAWKDVLDASRLFSEAQVRSKLEGFCEQGLDQDSVSIKYDKERLCLNSFLISKRTGCLDVACKHLDRDCFSSWLESKVPSLKTWAMNNMTESMVLPSKNKESVEWARSNGFYGQGVFRESHFADALVSGDQQEANIAMRNGGIEKLSARQLERILRAVAERKETTDQGIVFEGVEILWESAQMEKWLEDLAQLGDEALLMASELLLLSLSGSGSSALVEKVKKMKEQKAKRFFSQALLRGAFAHNAEPLARALMSKSQEVFGLPIEAVSQERWGAFLADAGGGKAALVNGAGPVSLSEACQINGKGAWMDKGCLGSNPERMAQLREATAKAVERVRRDWGTENSEPLGVNWEAKQKNAQESGARAARELKH